MQVSDTRVGQMTNYDKLTLEVITNGTTSPKEAIQEASSVLIEHYEAIIAGEAVQEPTEDTLASTEETLGAESVDASEINNKTKIEDLSLFPKNDKCFGQCWRKNPWRIEATFFSQDRRD